MRMRNKPWVQPELDASPFYIADPFQKGAWHQLFARKQPLYLELGCGKGNFIAAHASRHPEINFLGIDMISIVLASGCRHIKQAYAEANHAIDNVLLTPYDIERMFDIMDENDKVARIYINFCNPWPKLRQQKKRLTHPKQLERYKAILLADGEIHFKTDDDQLFADSLDYFKESGFTLTYQTDDLHQSGYDDNVMTEHEEKFTALGIKTKFLIAKYHG